MANMAEKVEEDHGLHLNTHALLRNYRSKYSIIRGARIVLYTHGNPYLREECIPVQGGVGKLQICRFATDTEEAKYELAFIYDSSRS